MQDDGDGGDGGDVCVFRISVFRYSPVVGKKEIVSILSDHLAFLDRWPFFPGL